MITWQNLHLPSNLNGIQNLERLWVNGDSVTQVFGFEGTGQVEEELYLERSREMRLENLTKLENIWTCPVLLANFSNLKFVIVIKCKELRNLFSSLNYDSRSFAKRNVSK